MAGGVPLRPHPCLQGFLRALQEGQAGGGGARLLLRMSVCIPIFKSFFPSSDKKRGKATAACMGIRPKKRETPENLSRLHLDRLRSREKKEIKCRGNVPLIYGLPWGGRKEEEAKGDWKAERRKKNKREGRKRILFILSRTLKTFFCSMCVYRFHLLPSPSFEKSNLLFCLSCLPPPPFSN